MKTAFDGVHIHIPNEYMTKFGDETFGNCDNVSDHTIDRVSGEIAKLIKEFPDRLTMASTGGSVTGDEKIDKASWQGNTKKLEKSGMFWKIFGLLMYQVLMPLSTVFLVLKEDLVAKDMKEAWPVKILTLLQRLSTGSWKFQIQTFRSFSNSQVGCDTSSRCQLH